MPSISVPPSPMNILERTPNTLCMKNGSIAPITITATNTIVMLHTEWNAMAKHTLASMP